MEEFTAAQAGPPAAVGYWNTFTGAVADVLGSGPSASRDTVLHALHACYGELKKVDPHLDPYLGDTAETVTRVVEAYLALGLAIKSGQAAAGPEGDGAAGGGPVPGGGPEWVSRAGSDSTAGPVPAGEPGSVPTAGPVPAGEPAPVPTAEPTRVPAAGPEPESERGPAMAPVTTTGPPAAGPGAETTAPEPDPEAQLARRLGELCAELASRHTRYLGGWRHPRPESRPGAANPQEPSAAWTALHLALLRLPEADCRRWRETAAKAAQECLRGPLPDWENQAAIVPALRGPEMRTEACGPGGSRDLVQEVTVPLDLSDAEALKRAAARAPSEVLTAVDVLDPGALDPRDLRLPWAARARQALQLTELDHDLQAIFYPGPSRGALAEEHIRTQYRIMLLTSLKGAARNHREPCEPQTRLRSAHKLDGVLGGLLHWPTAAPGSWWWRWRREVSLILESPARAVGHEVVYDLTSEWERHDLENCTEIKWDLGGTQGPHERLVQWVFLTPLRRVGVTEPQTDYPGRVVRRRDPAGT